MVTLTRVASLPRIRIPVYPIPVPPSLVTTTDGVIFRRKGKSCPRLCFSMSDLFNSENATDERISTRVAEILTSSERYNLGNISIRI